MATATRTITINDPVGIHARPAAQFATAVAGSGCTVTIAKGDGAAVAANSILSIMGLGVKNGDSVTITVDGDNAEEVADNLVNTLVAAN
ncbi:phosphotransferase [Bifidobacterium dolichotidis]|uniref:Phosphocarrier protein HPr n=1 Tax=Bifidobacterium dolichotidis TaxID=2306976 RepID=A0A430FQM3_9BIFI|nr:HPr family phosphocarrier protein [Bifidobacterium dolichotidis]RSX55142.1 phosphotransferase [Bifidobacterium dolichotidis]